MTALSANSSEYNRDIKSGTADAVLSGMWRQIMRDYQIEEGRIDDLIFEYSNKMTHLDANKRQQFRGNVPSDLRKDTMSWRAFVVGLMILGTTEFEVRLRLHHLNSMTEHAFTKTFPPPDQPGQDDDEEEMDESKAELKPRTDLSMFFSGILNDLAISISQFDHLLGNYMIRMRVPMTARNRTHVRGNLKKELMGRRLSWASLVKGLNFLKVTRFDFILTLKFKNGRESVHQRLIILNDREDLIEEIRLGEEALRATETSNPDTTH